jgi:protein-disulfide isomerase
VVIIIVGSSFAGSGVARAQSGAAGQPDDATVDAIVRKLESSGKLDAAVDRAIDRYVKRKEQARQQEIAGQAKLARAVDAAQDHIRGSRSAEVSLIEYADFECPFCKRFHETPAALIARYGGRVNWVFRNFPLPMHDPAAHSEASAAECVATLRGNDTYWKYSDALFASTRSNGKGLPSDKSIDKLAQAVGVQAPELAKCMRSDAIAKRIERDVADGSAAGVSGTPTTVVRNNRTGASEAVVGAVPVDALVSVIDRMLAAKP